MAISKGSEDGEEEEEEDAKRMVSWQNHTEREIVWL